ncbi:MAG: DUF2163 domain-containing protein [Hyphomonadaceae bacterium]
MRSIPTELAARLAGGVTTLAYVWRITRRDEAVFAFTDHDRPLTFDELTCEPMAGLRTGAIEKSAGLEVDSASLSGALSSDAISEADLARGLWDGARVDLYRVDWTDAALRLHLFAGRIGEVRRSASAFEAELRGLQAALNVPVGRVFSRFCDADLGDARCGANVETSAFRGEGVVTEIVSGATFRASGLEAFADAWFTRGRLQWIDGGESEVAAHRVGAEGAVIELIDAPAGALVEGAAFVVYAGCDKRIETCRAKFANTLNFRGFPHMPGNDALQAGPIANAPLDGGSRFET